VLIYFGTIALHSHPIDLLLRAFKIIVKKDKQIRLIIVGGGEDYELIQSLISSLNLDNYVRMVGRVPPEMIPYYIALADVSVDPVYDDMVSKARYPLKIIESLTMGVPVVTGDVGDRRYILENDVSGLLVQPGDIDKLASGLLSAVNSSKKTFRRDEIKKYSDRWDWNIIVRLFEDFYFEIESL